MGMCQVCGNRNRWILSNLKNKRDGLTLEVSVCHWIDFSSPEEGGKWLTTTTDPKDFKLSTVGVKVAHPRKHTDAANAKKFESAGEELIELIMDV